MTSLVAHTRCEMAGADTLVTADADPPDPFAALPVALLQRVLALLPVEERGRACVVCPRWRDALADSCAWTNLYFTQRSSATLRCSLLAGAAARARGRLVSLSATTLAMDDDAEVVNDLLEIARANGGTLREVMVLGLPLDAERLAELLRAAPRLAVLDVWFYEPDIDASVRVLRGESPYDTPALRFDCCHLGIGEGHNNVDLLALATALAAPGPRITTLFMTGTDAEPFKAVAFDALVSGLVARGVHSLGCHCLLQAECTPALTRLLRDGTALTSIDFPGCTMLDADGAALVAAALRGNCTLTKLKLSFFDVEDDKSVGCRLLTAMVAHRSLTNVVLSSRWEDVLLPFGMNDAHVADALAAVVAANAPPLRTLVLDVHHDAELIAALDAALAAALPRNTHLQRLECAQKTYRG